MLTIILFTTLITNIMIWQGEGKLFDFIRKYLNYKPFNCVLCFTFWLSLILSILLLNTIDTIIITVSLSMIMAQIYERKFNPFK